MVWNVELNNWRVNWRVKKLIELTEELNRVEIFSAILSTTTWVEPHLITRSSDLCRANFHIPPVHFWFQRLCPRFLGVNDCLFHFVFHVIKEGPISLPVSLSTLIDKRFYEWWHLSFIGRGHDNLLSRNTKFEYYAQTRDKVFLLNIDIVFVNHLCPIDLIRGVDKGSYIWWEKGMGEKGRAGTSTKTFIEVPGWEQKRAGG